MGGKQKKIKQISGMKDGQIHLIYHTVTCTFVKQRRHQSAKNAYPHTNPLSTLPSRVWSHSAADPNESHRRSAYDHWFVRLLLPSTDPSPPPLLSQPPDCPAFLDSEEFLECAGTVRCRNSPGGLIGGPFMLPGGGSDAARSPSSPLRTPAAKPTPVVYAGL